MTSVDLSKFDNTHFNPGRGPIYRVLWYMTNSLILKNSLNPFSGLKILVLKIFGAQIGKGIVLKPAINIKYPWNLILGDNVWIGENTWIDSLAEVKVGNNVCIAQGAYLCTGNHDWSDPSFGLITKPITVEDGVWIGAKAVVLPGVTLKSHSVITASSVIAKDTEPYVVYKGNPAFEVGKRKFNNQ